MTEKNPEKWVVWAQYADSMAKLCRYEEAIEAYNQAMPMRPKPRFIDCEQAIAHISEIRGNYRVAIEMSRQALQIVREDWAITEGETVEFWLREIDRLEKLLKN